MTSQSARLNRSVLSVCHETRSGCAGARLLLDELLEQAALVRPPAGVVASLGLRPKHERDAKPLEGVHVRGHVAGWIQTGRGRR